MTNRVCPLSCGEIFSADDLATHVTAQCNVLARRYEEQYKRLGVADYLAFALDENQLRMAARLRNADSTDAPPTRGYRNGKLVIL